MPQIIDLPDVIASAHDSAMQGMWTAMPGQIESFDATTQTAGISLTVKNRYLNETGDVVVEDLPMLPSVPVIFIGGGGFRVTTPLQRGDTVLVIFCSRPIGQWLVNGDVQDPILDHRHDLSAGVAIAGLRDMAHALSNCPTDRMSIGADDGATVEFTSSKIKVGGNSGTQPTYMGNDMNAALQTMFNAIATAVGTIPGGSGAAATISAAASTFSTSATNALTGVAEVK